MPQKIEISSKTIVFTVFFILFLLLLWQIKDLIFSLFIAFIISGALNSPVHFLEKKKFPRLLASILVYFLFIFVIFNLFSLVIPPLVQETAYFFKNFPVIVKSIPQMSSYIDLNLVAQNIPNLTNEFVSFVKGIFSNMIFITSTLFFSFYLLIDKNFIEKTLSNFYEETEAKKISHIIFQGQKRAGSWFWGELILMTVIGVLTYFGLTIIGMKYAAPLAVLAGLLEIIPNLGPIISAVPAALIGFSHSYILGLSSIVLYFIVQQLENNLIVPVIMKKIVGLHPIITLIALIVGGKLAGVLGVLLAVPTTIFIGTLLLENQKLHKK